jgi:NADH-quinone oxidoreductase subunit N
MKNNANLIFVLSPYFFLLFIIFFFFIVGVIYKNSFYYILITKVIKTLILLGLFLSCILFYNVAVDCVGNNSTFIVARVLKVDGFSAVNQLIILMLFILIFAVSTHYELNKGILSIEYIFLITFILISSLLLVLSNDLLVSYLLIELQSIPMYILLASFKESKKSIESAIKYFFLSAFSSAVLLFGVSLIYYFSDFTSYFDLGLFLEAYKFNSANFLENFFFISGVCFIIFSIFFKLSVAPLHFWSPDVYDGGPVSVVLVLSVIPKYSIFIFLINFLYSSLTSFFNIFSLIFIFFGILSIAVGTVGAFYFSKISRILAFGSVSQIGFVVLAVGCFTPDSTFVAIFYLVSYFVANILFFSLWLNLNFAGSSIIYITELYGFYRISPKVSVMLLISLLSFAGIPPTAGFFAKVLVLSCLLKNYNVLLGIIVFLLSTLSAIYYIRFIKFIFFYKLNDSTPFYKDPIPMAYLISVFLSITVFILPIILYFI